MSNLDPVPAVVVGVDDSPASRSAARIAMGLAAAEKRPLHLVTVVSQIGFPLPLPAETLDGEWQVLRDLEREAADAFPDLEVISEMRMGDAAPVLKQQAKKHSLLVVGKRGRGTFARAVLGSVSTAVAGRSDVPVLVVPAEWWPLAHLARPVVVGIDPEEDDRPVLRAAFAAAAERRVAMEVVHAIKIEPLLVWDMALAGPTYRHREEADTRLLEEAVTAMQEQFPDVSTTVTTGAGDAASVLLEHADGAQLLVMGRHHSNHFGFGLGSQTRNVLHHSETPVLVVPTT